VSVGRGRRPEVGRQDNDLRVMASCQFTSRVKVANSSASAGRVTRAFLLKEGRNKTLVQHVDCVGQGWAADARGAGPRVVAGCRAPSAPASLMLHVGSDRPDRKQRAACARAGPAAPGLLPSAGWCGPGTPPT
jgi:hypothetical protein